MLTRTAASSRFDWGKTVSLTHGRVLVTRLTQCGFQFQRPESVFPGRERGVTATIARIERDAGALPLALKLFWQRVGSVDLCGHHLEWEECDYPDPLVVYPPSIAVQELGEFLAHKGIPSRISAILADSRAHNRC